MRAWVACALLSSLPSCSANGCHGRKRVQHDTTQIRLERAQAARRAGGDGWSQHELVAEQDLPVVESRCTSFGLDATRDPPTKPELEAAFRSVAPALRHCLEAGRVRPLRIVANVHGATGSIAGAKADERDHSVIPVIDTCIRASFAALCVPPFQTPPGYAYIAWSFDELADGERTRPVSAAAATALPDDPLLDVESAFIDHHRSDWCATGIDREAGSRVAKENGERGNEAWSFFNVWTPVEAPRGCDALPPPSATNEVRYPRLGDAEDPANALLRACMQAHGVRDELPIALEMDASTGCVTRAMARTEPRKPTLDQCVARALSRVRYSWPREHKPRIWRTYRPRGTQPSDTLRALAQVPSKCPSKIEPSKTHLPLSEHIQPHLALRKAELGLHRCLKKFATAGRASIVVNFHAPTGRAVGAAALLKPRIAKLDACLADALATTCLPPSKPPEPGGPYFSIRHRMFGRPFE